MKLHSVHDFSFDDCVSAPYDLMLFVNGSEPRCTEVWRQMKSSGCDLANAYILRIAEDEKGIEHSIDVGFGRNERCIDLDANKSKGIFDFLSAWFDGRASAQKGSDELRIFVDYSSMPRVWYASIIAWLSVCEAKACSVDMVYAVGQYVDTSERKQCTRIESLPGCSSIDGVSSHKLLIIGLGFDALAPFALYNCVEPDETIAFVSNPAANEDVKTSLLKTNSEFIEEYCNGEFMSFPLRSVERFYSILGSYISVSRLAYGVVLAPLGAKPHILASILLCQKYDNTICLRVNHSHSRPYDVRATGEVLATKVVFCAS